MRDDVASFLIGRAHTQNDTCTTICKLGTWHGLMYCCCPVSSSLRRGGCNITTVFHFVRRGNQRWFAPMSSLFDLKAGFQNVLTSKSRLDFFYTKLYAGQVMEVGCLVSCGFAINWKQNQITRLLHLHDLTHSIHCIQWFMWCCSHNWVSMVVADGLVPF